MPIRDIEQRREYNRKWIAARRAEFFKDKECIICGSKDDLELDHIDPSLKVSHRIWSWTKERRDLELKKCQILCRSHHLEKSISEISHDPIHGTLSAYDHYGCRCDNCKQAKSIANKKRYTRS